MRLADYWRSAPFRIAATYAGLFSLSAVLLLAVSLWAATRDVKEQIREAVQQDVRALLNVYVRDGVRGLEESIRTLSGSVEGNRSLYLLQDAHGRLIAGNGGAVDVFEGWKDLPLIRESKRPDHFVAVGTRLDGSFLVVGRRAHAIWELQETLLKSFAWALGVMLPLALIGGLVMGRRSLRRVDEIRSTTRQIVAGDFSRRVSVTGADDDIDRLARDINYMLQRIENLMEGLKQVTNDVAHDLRTPLSRLRQRLDLARQSEKTLDGFQNCVDLAVEEINGILSTFNALLHIAQIDSGASRSRFAKVDLSEIARAIGEVYEDVAEDNGQTIAIDVADGMTAEGDRNLLVQLLANLVENAIRHTPPGTQIDVRVWHDADGAVVTVGDSGPGIPAGERERVFRRFYRLDSSRTTPGSGLGLSLVRAIAGLHGAVVTLTDNVPGLLVTVRFP